MNKIVLILITVPLFAIAQNKGIQWIDKFDWNKLIVKAKNEGKFIFIDCYATWCGPCKLMDKNIYTNDTIAKFINEKFLSIKLQMDETPSDNNETKERYAYARYISAQYQPEGYPTFLFFSSEGQLIHKDIGYKTVEKFLELIKFALTDPIYQFEKKVQLFYEGRLAFEQMLDLIKQARSLKRIEIAKKVVKYYKENWLDKLGDSKMFNKENLNFIIAYAYDLVSSKDAYFNFFYKHSSQADSIIGLKEGKSYRKVSDILVRNTILREEVLSKAYINGDPVLIEPKWKKILKTIQKKYGSQIDASQMVFDAQISYYKKRKNWSLYISYFTKKVQQLGFPSLGLAPVNIICATFKHCHDSLKLVMALKWVEHIMLKDISSNAWILLVKDGKDNNPGFSAGNDFTNYAALLYNSGRKKEAIQWMELHIKLLSLASQKPNGETWVNELPKKMQILKAMQKGEAIDDIEDSWFW